MDFHLFTHYIIYRHRLSTQLIIWDLYVYLLLIKLKTKKQSIKNKKLVFGLARLEIY
jgi:hypothetical protein